MNRPQAIEDLISTAKYIQDLEDELSRKRVEVLKLTPPNNPVPFPEAKEAIEPIQQVNPAEMYAAKVLYEPRIQDEQSSPVEVKPPVKIAPKRIAFLGNFTETYCSEFHHAKSLEALGHTVIRLQEARATASQILAAAKQCDAFVWVHTHSWATPKGGYGPGMRGVLAELKRLGIPTLSYHLDLWKGLKREVDMRTDEVWDIEHFFTVDKQMADWFNDPATGNGKTKGHYLPAGVYHAECQLQDVPRTNDVIFVGSRGYHSEYPYRTLLLDWLTGNYKERFKHYGGGGLPGVRGQQLNDLYAQTKIVIGDSLCLNFNYEGYWSDRVYETLGRGGFIIHPYIKGMENHFTDRKHLVFYEYNNFGQLKELIDYYLTHDEEREKIRKAGHEHVKANHTYVQRWQTITQTLFT